MKLLRKHEVIWLMLIVWVSSTPLFLKISLTTPNLASLIKLVELSFFSIIAFVGMTYLIKFRFKKNGSWLFLGMIFLYIPPLLAQKFGYVPHYNFALWRLVFILVLVCMLPPITTDRFIKFTKKLLLMYIYGSLFFMALIPDWVLDTSYSQGLIDGFNIRLSGLAGHANSLAPLIFIYLILDLYVPAKPRIRMLHNSLAMIVLILNQSKTVWILLALSYLFYVVYNKVIRVKGRKIFLGLGVSNFIISICCLIVVYFGVLGQVETFIEQNKLYEFTGRAVLWDITIQSWKLSPLFGYGLELWGDSMQQTYFSVLQFTPGTAHNQVLQTLGESGVIGVFGLVIFIAIFLWFSFKYSKQSNGITIILFMFIFIRSVTEVTLPISINNVGFNVQFVAFSLLILMAKQEDVKERYEIAKTHKMKQVS